MGPIKPRLKDFQIGAAQKAKGLPDDKLQQVFRELQPRRGRQELIPEFKEVIKLAIHSTAELEDSLARFAKKQRIFSVGGLPIDEKIKVLNVAEAEAGSSSGSSILIVGFVSIGIPWTEDEFLEQATKLAHPYDWEVVLPRKIADAIAHIAESGPTMLKRYRLEQLAYWTQRAAALKVKEAEVHSRLHPDVEAIIAPKNILLFKEMLEAISYDDMGVVDLLLTGVQVVGTLDKIGIWKPEDRSAKLSTSTLILGAQAAQEDSARLRPECAEDDVIWQITMEEVEDGCLTGPYSISQLSQKLGKHWVLRGAHPQQSGSL